MGIKNGLINILALHRLGLSHLELQRVRKKVLERLQVNPAWVGVVAGGGSGYHIPKDKRHGSKNEQA